MIIIQIACVQAGMRKEMKTAILATIQIQTQSAGNVKFTIMQFQKGENIIFRPMVILDKFIILSIITVQAI